MCLFLLGLCASIYTGLCTGDQLLLPECENDFPSEGGADSETNWQAAAYA